MKTVQICFLWHMHQPYYTDPVSGSASMPWVRLHATKAYFDMASLIARFPTVRATFNLTPSLLVQLKELASGSIRDLFLEHARRPAAELTPAERAFLVRHFFAANWATMVRPFPRYHELLVKRGTEVQGQDLERLARQFTTQELLDLQVWHNLAWFGYGAVARFPRLAALRLKDRGFTEEDKQEILAIQQQVVAEIIPFYRRLAEAGHVELTTSPFYHPILPLLIDTELARRSVPETPLPQRLQVPDDAEAQIRNAVTFHAELFGAAPAGLWPSEGSVCPEMVPMLRRVGLRWIATDEGVLARSLDGWDRKDALYHPYRIGQPGEEVTILFRDRDLSDAIGFVYAKTTPESAVDNLLQRLHTIAHQAPANEVLVPIILDGENPWEYYHDGGERFLSRLYAELARGLLDSTDDIRITADTVSHALAAHPEPPRLEHLHTGSWINADFKIWIGHPEDNQAWDLLRHTRQHLADTTKTLSPQEARSAWEELYAAEGSDWTWWYGDDFETDYRPEFDRLFRTHLRNVFLLTGASPPEYLNQPLVQIREADQAREPVNLLFPTIDGLVTDFFEWRGAGTINPSPALGAMWKANKFFTYIGVGFSLDALFLRLDPGEDLASDRTGLAAEVHILDDGVSHRLAFSLVSPEPETFTLDTAAPGQPWAEVGRYATICRRKVIELGVPFKDLGLQPGREFRLSLVVTQDGLEAERYPRHRPMALTVPDEDFEARMWKV